MALHQIHPQIDDDTECKLMLMGVKPSQALKEYANDPSSAQANLDNAIKLLKAKKEFYLSMLNQAKSELDKINAEIQEKEQKKKELNDMHKNDYKSARLIIKERFKQIKEQKNKTWSVKKMSDKEIDAICLQYGLSAPVLLNGFSKKELKEVLVNYQKYL